MGAPSQMGQGHMNQNMGGGENMGGDRSNMPNPIKKMPNPANFKIVKCKNFDAGNLFYFPKNIKNFYKKNPIKFKKNKNR
jgi:hypothetical protein